MLGQSTPGSQLPWLPDLHQDLLPAAKLVDAELHIAKLRSAKAQNRLPLTAFFYGAQVPASALAKFERVVVEADQVPDLRLLRAAGADIFAYVSVGEAEGWRSSARALPPEWFLGCNASWGSRIADLTHPGWRHYLLDERMAGLWATGYRAFFLDTLDSYRIATKDAAQERAQTAALVQLVTAMHDCFPGVKLLLNRGFDVLPEVAQLCVGVVAESLFQGWHAGLKAYVRVSKADRRWLLNRLNDAKDRFGLPVTVIDYVSPAEPALARDTARRIAALGFSPWVSGPGLDVLPIWASDMNQHHAAFTKLSKSLVRLAAWAGAVVMSITDAAAQGGTPGVAPGAASTEVSASAPPAELAAARAAWEGGTTDARVPERLIELLKSNRQPGLAIAVGEEAYQRFGDARWLLLAMDTALGASLPQELRRLLGIARRNEEKFAGVEFYWLLNAHVAVEDRDRPAARVAYNRALAINPSSVATRTQILAFEIDGNETESLGQHLDQWQGDAQSNPAFWTPYAVGLVKVNRPDESIPWYERQVGAKPDDILWQLSYAYVLSEAGRPAEAQRLRRGILKRLQDNPGVIDTLSVVDRKSLMLAHASMARDFEGVPAGDRVLQDMVARGYRDADVYSQLVASSLAMQNVKGAHQWLLKAEADGHTLPAYQVLGVALGRNDRLEISKVLQERGAELTVTDRITALRRSGRPVEALALVDSSLPQASEETGRQLRQQRYEIASEQARRVDIRLEKRNISELDIARTEVWASQPAPWGRTTVRLARNALRSENGSPNLTFARDENDLSVMADLMVAGDPFKLTLGTNQRSDVSFAYGSAEWIHTLTKGVRARVEAAINALTEESAAVRAVGKKDKLLFGLSGNPSPRTNARVEVAGQRFQTRSGDYLGKGLHVEGEFGGVVMQGSPTLQVRLSGSADRNRLAASLPPGLAGTVLSQFSTVESLIPRRFSTLGAGSTLLIGQAYGPDRGANGLVDVWVGRQWPSRERAYSLRVAAALPVHSAGEFKLEAYYSNVQTGVASSGRSYRGIAVGYRHEF